MSAHKIDSMAPATPPSSSFSPSSLITPGAAGRVIKILAEQAAVLSQRVLLLERELALALAENNSLRRDLTPQRPWP
jgi:hypothetical protein